MKIKLLTFALLCYTLANAQITKAETFLIGTKVSFYPNQCGNAIPEATGKLTFCDGQNNLGVVERSYGLNNRGVTRMFPNHFNSDEVYATEKGLSIRNENGTWENIPNIAVPSFNTQGDWTNLASIQNGLVLPDGRIMIRSITGLGPIVHVYDRTLKTFEPLSFPNNRFPQLVVYDEDRNLTWIIAFDSSNRFLFTYDGTNLNLVEQLTDIQNVDVTISLATLIYHDDYLYLAGFDGLHKIDVSNYTQPPLAVTSYDSTTTPGLPFDQVSGLQFDANDDLWLSQGSVNSDGGIVKFNITSETYDLYQLESIIPGINEAFQSIALDENSVIWTTSSYFSGIIELKFVGNTPQWNLQSPTDLEALGVPMTYTPNNIYFRNNKFYFTTNDFSSGSNSNFEVVINNDGVWSGRNDNELGNLSERMHSRFHNSMPDANGGVWWFNTDDEIVVYRDVNDNHQSILIENLGNASAIDDDEQAIIKGGPLYEIQKVDFPNVNTIQVNSNEANDMKRVLDQVWIYSRGDKKIEAYKDDVLIHTYNLDEDWYLSAYHFAVDDNGDAWFVRNNSGIEIKKFDTSAQASTTYDMSSVGSLGALRKVVAAPNGSVWFLGNSGAVYQENETFYSFLFEDYPNLFGIQDMVVDVNGKAYLLNDSSTIISIENPSDVNPTLSNIHIGGNNSILPALEHFLPRTITIDSEGNIWTHASQNAFKLIDGDFAIEYIPQPEILNISENSLNAEINVFPNPSNGLITINSTVPIDKVEVYSVLGELIMVIENSNTLKLQNQSTGMYILKITSSDRVAHKKILVR
ncbi:T9SS type A sorting domain-containing protein [uncultured Psychroserpens sp.]|uniref:T9SS type A sorting domain-containing protein n=1 Tax=uncultured Psychroserpens sp. TaxID=255436 RepID=UPI00262992D6|nr:T9SS type A sorting domain-containing protein [uncultured Psychroserpens sp.]